MIIFVINYKQKKIVIGDYQIYIGHNINVMFTWTEQFNWICSFQEKKSYTFLIDQS